MTLEFALVPLAAAVLVGVLRSASLGIRSRRPRAARRVRQAAACGHPLAGEELLDQAR